MDRGSRRVVRALQTLRPGSLHTPPAEWTGELPGGDPTHGANVRLAEFNGLLDGVTLSGWDIWAKANRGEAARILWNVAGMGS